MPSFDDDMMFPEAALPDEEGLCLVLLINTLFGLHTVLHTSIYPNEGLAVNISFPYFLSLYKNVYFVTLTIPFNLPCPVRHSTYKKRCTLCVVPSCGCAHLK